MSEIESTDSTSNPKMGNYDLGASNRLFLDVYGDQKQKNKKQSKHPMKLIETKKQSLWSRNFTWPREKLAGHGNHSFESNIASFRWLLGFIIFRKLARPLFFNT
jgi:hypothetical protein